MTKDLEMVPNKVAAFLRKPCGAFTKDDMIGFITSNGIQMVNFMYPAEDGRLKTLNFMINNLAYLENVLTCGERVDGSSLFPSFIEAGNSDLYVIPRFRTAFVDPFAEIPTLCLLCSFYDKEGKAPDCSPETTLRRASKVFTEKTGLTFEAMGELEYYVISPESELFPATNQRGYHESGPYTKTGEFRQLCMNYIAQTGGQIKYGHSEVGNFTQEGLIYEQNEIEFLPCPVETAADQLMLAKWVIRNLAERKGLNVTFAPKIITGNAGSGLHIHMRLMRDGHNCMTKDGLLSEEARRAIAGMMLLAKSITAFGNKNPTSYFRLVPHQEAPTNVCWGDRNRSVLVRVPLGWTTDKDMCAETNPHEKASEQAYSEKQTVEIRSADCSADIYQLMAGLCVACREGLELPREEALKIAADKYVDTDIHKLENKDRLATLDELPVCCAASGDCLEKDRAAYEKYNVFSHKMIDGIIRSMKAFDDWHLHQEASNDSGRMKQLVAKYFHCG